MQVAGLLTRLGLTRYKLNLQVIVTMGRDIAPQCHAASYMTMTF